LKRPTFHSLCHPPLDQLLFGDDIALSTQAFEKSHRQIAKIPFQRETNRTNDQESLHKQMFHALYQRSFQVQRPSEGAVRNARVLEEGLVSQKVSSVAAVVAKIWFSDESIKFEEDSLYDTLSRLVRSKGTFNRMTVASGISKQSITRGFLEGLKSNSASGFRLANGVVIRPSVCWQRKVKELRYQAWKWRVCHSVWRLLAPCSCAHVSYSMLQEA
jgi:hypothetical protein